MTMLIKPHQYSTWMTSRKISNRQWVEILARPRVYAEKSSAPLVIWGNMVDKTEPDLQTNMPRCTGNNIAYITALQVDIDNGCTIDEFTREYDKYSFQLYTSYSYGYKPSDRFRAIFPLAERIYMEHICPSTKKVMRDVFPMVDVTCFDKGHWQILPALREPKSPYRYLSHDGKKLSEFTVDRFSKLFEEYDTVRKLNDQIRELDRVGKQKPESNYSKALEWAQQQIDGAEEGSRNRTYFSVLNWLHSKVGCDLYDVLDLEVPSDMQDEFTEMAARIFNQ